MAEEKNRTKSPHHLILEEQIGRASCRERVYREV